MIRDEEECPGKCQGRYSTALAKPGITKVKKYSNYMVTTSAIFLDN